MEVRTVNRFLAYARKLNDMVNPPEKLFYIGDERLLSASSVAVIGKREASFDELAFAYNIGRLLAKEGIVVINGIARGCDQAAIHGALDGGGKVILVMPCGIGDIYPVSAKELYQRAERSGCCIVSEYAYGEQVKKNNFIKRDEIQAALADKIIVVSADQHGGTMHTVRDAQRLGREICCWYRPNGNTATGNAQIISHKKGRAVKTADEALAFAKEPIYKQLRFC